MRRRYVLGLALAAALAVAGCGAGTPAEPVPAPDRPEPLATPTPITTLLALRTVGERVPLRSALASDVLAGATYAWRQVDGPPAALSDATAQQPTIAPSEAGVYVFELTVTDGELVIALALVEVPVAPAAAAGLSIVAPVPGLFGGTLAIDYRLLDTAADPASVELSFSTDGGTSYMAATEVSGGTRASARSADGSLRRVVWDAAADLEGEVVADIVVRVTLDGASSNLAMTHAPLFDEISFACAMDAQAWPFHLAAREEIGAELDACQAALAEDVVAFVRTEVAPLLPDLDETLLLNLPLFIAAHAMAARDGRTGPTELAFLLERALVLVAQLESVTLAVGIDPGEAQGDGPETSKYQALSNMARLRHEMAMATIRNLR